MGFQDKMSRNTSSRSVIGTASPRNAERIRRLDQTIKNSRMQFQKEEEALDYERMQEVLFREVVDSPTPDVLAQEYSGLLTPKSCKSDSTRITYYSDRSGGSRGQTPEYLSYASIKNAPYLSISVGGRSRGIGALSKYDRE